MQKNISGHKSKLKAWWQASRPPFYIATLIPVVLAYILAGKDTGKYNPLVLAVVMLVSLLQHLSANLANDLFDHLLGVDSEESIGGSRVIQEGSITVRELKVALAILYSCTVLLTIVGSLYLHRPYIILIMIFAMFSSLFYVAPPIRYGHKALGELFVFLNMGLCMTAGVYYVFTDTLTLRSVMLSLPIGLMVAGILYYQSLPEIYTDKDTGKHTLANVLGPLYSITLQKLWWPVIWSLLLLLWLKGWAAWPVIIGIVCCLPLYIKLNRKLVASQGEHFNWLSLDAHGHLVRKMYLLCGLALIFSVALF